jgi:hypothetical protein
MSVVKGKMSENKSHSIIHAIISMGIKSGRFINSKHLGQVTLFVSIV